MPPSQNEAVLGFPWVIGGVRDLHRLRWPSAGPSSTWAGVCRRRVAAVSSVPTQTLQDRAGHADRFAGAAALRPSNSKLEGRRLEDTAIDRHGYGHRSAATVVAMNCLCCGGLTLDLPTDRWLTVDR